GAFRQALDLLTVGANPHSVRALDRTTTRGAVAMGRTVRRLLLGTSVALLCSIMAIGPAAAAGGRVWTELRPALPSPPRAAMTMEFDPVSGFVVTFGGFDDTGQYLNQTWIWDGIEWAQPIVQTPPPARAGADMAYDRVTHQPVLLGGFDRSSYLGDTWTWEGATNQWARRQSATKPPAVPG